MSAYPTSEKGELGIIGCCICGGLETSLEAVEQVPIDALTRPDVRDALKVLEHMATQGRVIDAVTFLGGWKALYGGFPPQTILSAQDDVPSAQNLSYYSGEVLEAWHKRRLMEVCFKVFEDGKNSNTQSHAMLADMEKALAGNDLRGVETFDGKACSRRLVDDLERRHALGGRMSGVSTGFHKLDEKTDGVQYGEQFIVGARPSAGKTALGTTIAANAAYRLKIPTLFISLEMSVEALMRRICSAWTQIPMNEIRRGSYNEQQFKKFTTFQAMAANSPLWITDAVSGMSISQLSAVVRRFCRKHSVKLVIIDYLQKVKSVERQEKKTYEIGDVSTALRALAVSSKVAMLTLAQLNRESEKDKNPRSPRLSDLGDSKQIEQDADTVTLIHRDRMDKTGATSLIVAKQRDGETGMIDLHFNGPLCRFENPVLSPEI